MLVAAGSCHAQVCLKVDSNIVFLTVRRYLQQSNEYFKASEHLKSDNFPSNDTTGGIAGGLAAAHKAYGKPEYVSYPFLLK